jgi:hypothetical protein
MSEPTTTVLFTADGIVHNRPRDPEMRFRAGEIVAMRASSARWWIERGVATDDTAAIEAARGADLRNTGDSTRALVGKVASDDQQPDSSPPTSPSRRGRRRDSQETPA